MKLTIKNNTDYRTDDIRRLFLRAYKESGLYRRHYTLLVEKKRVNGHVLGKATYNGSWMKLYLSPPERNDYYSSPVRVAKTMLHEFQHSKGIHHKDMIDNFDCSWDSEYPLRLVEPKIPVKVDLVSLRYENARKILSEWDKKLTRAKSFHRKWSVKVKYYERAVASKRGVQNDKN